MYCLNYHPLSDVGEDFPLRGQDTLGSQSMPSEDTAKTARGAVTQGKLLLLRTP